MGAVFGAALPVYLLVFVRMVGMFAFNPLFSRRNVPAIVRAGLALVCMAVIAPGVPYASQVQDRLASAVLLELVIGLACGYIFQAFYYMLFMAGDFMDMQFGMAMSKVLDPGTNLQLSTSGSFLNILFSLYFFATNSHLVMIRILSASFDLVPAGGSSFPVGLPGYLIDLTIEAFSLVLRLALPFVAVEFVLELSMGILMKLIPQIHVFVINIQCKVLLALVMLYTFAIPVGTFLDGYIETMLGYMQNTLQVFR